MLGHRGTRLSVTYPEIAQMQTEAIVSAAVDTNAEKAELFLPLIGTTQEYLYVLGKCKETMEEVFLDVARSGALRADEEAAAE